MKARLLPNASPSIHHRSINCLVISFDSTHQAIDQSSEQSSCVLKLTRPSGGRTRRQTDESNQGRSFGKRDLRRMNEPKILSLGWSDQRKKTALLKAQEKLQLIHEQTSATAITGPQCQFVQCKQNEARRCFAAAVELDRIVQQNAKTRIGLITTCSKPS